MIAVHAGLEKSKGVEEQLKLLKARNTILPKVEQLSGRHDVWEMPKVTLAIQLFCRSLRLLFSFDELTWEDIF